MIGLAFRIRVFDDWKSFIHFIVGLIIGLTSGLSSTLFIMVFLLFTVYEILESKSVGEFVGDEIEFLSGVFIGELIRLIV